MRLILGLDKTDGGNRDGLKGSATRVPSSAARGSARCSSAREPVHPAVGLQPSDLAWRRNTRDPAQACRRDDRPAWAPGGRRKRVGQFSIGMANGSGSPRRCSPTAEHDPRRAGTNGPHPEGIQWIPPTFLKEIAAGARTVFLSSHLMSEMDADRRAYDRGSGAAGLDRPNERRRSSSARLRRISSGCGAARTECMTQAGPPGSPSPTDDGASRIGGLTPGRSATRAAAKGSRARVTPVKGLVRGGVHETSPAATRVPQAWSAHRSHASRRR